MACSLVKKNLFRFYKIESDTIFEKFSRFLNRSQLLPFFLAKCLGLVLRLWASSQRLEV